jgi:hypothetical protein
MATTPPAALTAIGGPRPSANEEVEELDVAVGMVLVGADNESVD